MQNAVFKQDWCKSEAHRSTLSRMRIAELFPSVQGEGVLTGTPSVFVRTSGCNLRCWFCDTPYASWNPEGETRSVDDIIETVMKYECEHVVITGGEPLVAAGIEELCNRLAEQGRHITIETAGTVMPEGAFACDLMSISPKLSNSAPDVNTESQWHRRHEQTRYRPQVVYELIQAAKSYQLKFVVGSILDAEESLEYLSELPDIDRDHVYMMPRGVTHEELVCQSEWLRPWCQQHSVKVCDRMQIHWFGNTRGT